MTAAAGRGLPSAPALLDGAMGTALLARGLPHGALPDEWVLEQPEAVAAVHAEHAAAGARVVLTCTFSLAAPRLEARLPLGRIDDLADAAFALARRAAPGALVAGAVGPTGLVGPGRSPRAESLRARYARALEALAAAGADLLWIESQLSLAEAREALAAAAATGLPAVATFTFGDEAGRLRAFDGTPFDECLSAVAAEGAAAAGANCLAPGPALARLAAWAREALPIPLVLKPSPGLPGAVLPPAAFAAALAPALAERAAFVGGCCGATGDHLRAVAATWRA